jgi:hypothetical protein
MKDSEIREVVNQVRDIALKYHDCQQLRDRIAGVLVPILGAANGAEPVDEHAAFEAAFKMPSQCSRSGDGYVSHGYSAWDAHNYTHKWAGWQARAKIAAPVADKGE